MPENELRRVTNAELKRDLQRIEGRVIKQGVIVEKIEPIIGSLATLAENTATLQRIAKEDDDKRITWGVLRQWARWDSGVRTFLKAVFGALIVAICTVVVYHWLSFTPTIQTPPPHTTPTAISTPTAIPIPVP